MNNSLILGAILAGGTGRRFGADKALALLDGQPLIAHVAAALQPCCDELAICGRAWGGYPALTDRPAPGLGPLGGLAAALHYATIRGHRAVLLAPCDMPNLPDRLPERLAGGKIDAVQPIFPPTVAERQWLLGLWPVTLLTQLEAVLVEKGAISMREWLEISQARRVDLGNPANINSPDDLRQFSNDSTGQPNPY